MKEGRRQERAPPSGRMGRHSRCRTLKRRRQDGVLSATPLALNTRFKCDASLATNQSAPLQEEGGGQLATGEDGQDVSQMEALEGKTVGFFSRLFFFH